MGSISAFIRCLGFAAAAAAAIASSATHAEETETELLGNTTSRTGKQARQAQPDNRCQVIGGQTVCGPFSRTHKNIPPGPNFQGNQPAQPPAAKGPRAEITLVQNTVERCTASWERNFQWVGIGAPAIESHCKKAAPADVPYLHMRTMRDMAALVFDNYKDATRPNREPILIAKIAYQQNQYLIALSGTEFKMKQATGLLEDIQASLNMADPYSLFLLSALHEYNGRRGVPHGASIILVGHSLGGMVAQHFASDRERFFQWTPLKVLTIGSPRTSFLPSTQVTQFAGEGDPVVSLSPIAFTAIFSQISVDSGAPGKWPGDIQNHLNYPKSVKLGNYDAMGNPQ
jgi:hypothetical protein